MIRGVIDRRIESASAEAKAARAEVAATIEALRHRIDPRVLAVEAAEGTLARATRVVENLGDAAKARPWILAIGATAFGLAVTLRSKLATDSDGTDEDEATNPDT